MQNDDNNAVKITQDPAGFFTEFTLTQFENDAKVIINYIIQEKKERSAKQDIFTILFFMLAFLSSSFFMFVVGNYMISDPPNDYLSSMLAISLCVFIFSYICFIFIAPITRYIVLWFLSITFINNIGVSISWFGMYNGNTYESYQDDDYYPYIMFTLGFIWNIYFALLTSLIAAVKLKNIYRRSTEEV